MRMSVVDENGNGGLADGLPGVALRIFWSPLHASLSLYVPLSVARLSSFATFFCNSPISAEVVCPADADFDTLCVTKCSPNAPVLVAASFDTKGETVRFGGADAGRATDFRHGIVLASGSDFLFSVDDLGTILCQQWYVGKTKRSE